MIREIKEIQRQIEIAAMVYEKPSFYSEFELADIFKTSPTTIRRDLKALRTTGADIHSRKGRLAAYFSLKDLNKLISTYFSLSSPIEFKDLASIRNRFKAKTLSVFVTILKAIREKREVQADFRFSKDSEKVRKFLSPLYLIDGGKSYYLITHENAEIRFFRLETLEEIKILRTRQQKNPPMLYEIFKNSWGIYTGGEETEVILKFNRDMRGYIDQKNWMANQDIEYVKDGILLKMKVKLSYEFIAWVMGWGDMVEVISPGKLKVELIKKAKGIVKLYN